MLSLLNTAGSVLDLYKRYRGSAPRRKKSKRGDVVSGRIRFAQDVTLSSGAAQITMDDVNCGCTLITDMGQLYRWFRFTRISVEVLAPDWTTAASLTVGFVPTTYVAADPGWDLEAEHLITINKDSTVSKELVVPREALLPMSDKWYVTTSDATDSTLESQGVILFRGYTSSAEVVKLVISISYEFKEMLDTAVVGVFANAMARHMLAQENCDCNSAKKCDCRKRPPLSALAPEVCHIGSRKNSISETALVKRHASVQKDASQRGGVIRN
jgi:hypothetical protein